MIREHACSNGHKGRLWLPLGSVNTKVTCPFCNVVEDVANLLPDDLKTKEELERKELERLKKIYEKPEEFIAEYHNVKLSFWQRQYLKLCRRFNQ